MVPYLIVLVVLLSACNGYTSPPSWTLRRDGHIRALQRNEDFTLDQWLDKVRDEEKIADGKEFGILLTPAGAQAITQELLDCHAKAAETK